MKRIIPILLLTALATDVCGQITITSADMPVNGDTLRHSTVIPLGFTINLADVGTGKVWNFDTMTSVTQKVDAYKTAIQVNPLYGFTISATAYGYKVADTFGGAGGTPLPVTVTDVYTFFNKKGTAPTDRYIAEGFAANISGAPIPAAYTNEDEIFFFPLDYGDKDTSDYYLNVNIPSVGRMVQNGKRMTEVDAWGTITTPYFTSPAACLRIRSEVNGTDSFQLGSFPAMGIPRQTVDYYWLVQGEHYPALWISTNMVGNTETISNVRYRDSYRPVVSVREAKGSSVSKLEVFPNPAGDMLQIAIPAGKTNYLVEVFDMQGKRVAAVYNKATIPVAGLSTGSYLVRVSFDDGIGYTQFAKQ